LHQYRGAEFGDSVVSWRIVLVNFIDWMRLNVASDSRQRRYYVRMLVSPVLLKLAN
jgi:hypothetical protein